MSLKLQTPESFPAFPYNPPYDIQLDLMRHLYEAIEEKKVAIVESPTGTGKTLSLLCASLTWLADEKDRARKGKLAALATGNELDWVLEQTIERQKRELEADEREYEERLSKARKRETIARKLTKGRVVKKPKISQQEMNDDDDRAFLPENETEAADDGLNLSPVVRALMEKLHKTKGGTSSEEAEPICTKIYYASRTHSQLTQVMPELRKLKLSPVSQDKSSLLQASSKKRAMDDEDEDLVQSYTRTVALGSRKQLCIHDKLREKSRDLDESCRELLGEKDEKRCPHLPSSDEDGRIVDFRDEILASPKDIEDLAGAGRVAHVCPYFGSRRAIPQAELVTLPYNLLLSKTAREALGIDLTDQVVIIDEAHNLISALLSLAAAHLPINTLITSLEQVSVYWSKFRNRLSTVHALHIKRLIVFLSALRKYAGEWKEEKLKAGKTGEKIEVMTVDELVKRLGRKVEGINLLEVESYLRSSKIARKVSGYSDRLGEKATEQGKHSQPRRGATPPLHAVEAFMLALTSAKDDGRVSLSIVGSPGQETVELKYQQLNPATHFREVVDAARCVILAGGTMSPMSDFTTQLFHHLPSERVSTFSCGHIIPPENLQTLILTKGPSGRDLNFKFDQQNDQALIKELGQVLINFVNLIPRGLVVFFPSYRFLNTVKEIWGTNGVVEKLNKKKKVFWEPQESGSIEQILQQYSAEVKNMPSSGRKPGALLFAVIGAKLSEGLNFSDDLARAVIVVGLPFANLGSPELQERLKYIKTMKISGSKDAASEFYSNLCMNAVNQSIGRAIRHKQDWASLILIDQRYTLNTIYCKLPIWINQKHTVLSSFSQAIQYLTIFYFKHL